MLLNITFPPLRHKCRSDNWCQMSKYCSYTQALYWWISYCQHECILSADSGKHPYTIRIESSSCFCLYFEGLGMPTLQEFQIFLVIQMRFSANHHWLIKTEIFCRRLYMQKKKKFLSCSATCNAIWELLHSYSCSSYVTTKQRKEPQWRLFRLNKASFLSLINHLHINPFHVIILVFSQSLILAHSRKAGLPCLQIEGKIHLSFSPTMS